MKTILLALLLALCAQSARALEIVAEKTVYHDCTALRVEGATLRFSHANGTARVRYDMLSLEIQEKAFGTARIAALREQDRAEWERVRLAREAAERASAEQARADAAKRDAERLRAARLTMEQRAAERTAQMERDRAQASAAADIALRNSNAVEAAAAQKERDRLDNILAGERGVAAFDAKQKMDAQAHALAMEDASRAEVFQTVLRIVLVVVGFMIYFFPAYIGRHKGNATAILVLNIFLGWTFIGWVVALVWATTKEVET